MRRRRRSRPSPCPTCGPLRPRLQRRRTKMTLPWPIRASSPLRSEREPSVDFLNPEPPYHPTTQQLYHIHTLRPL